MELTVFLAWATLLFGVSLNMFVTILSYRKHHKAPYLRVLQERFITSLVLTVVILFFGLIFVNNDQEIPPLGLDATKLITRFAMLALAIIPAVGWILLYRKSERKRK